jgi:hypothetical protein
MMAAQPRYVVYSPNFKEFADLVASAYSLLVPGAYVVVGDNELDIITVLAQAAGVEAYALKLADDVILKL